MSSSPVRGSLNKRVIQNEQPLRKARRRRLRQSAHSQTCLVAMRLKFCFCFHPQKLALRHTRLKLQVLQALPNIELSLQLSASVALDLRSPLGTHSLCVAVGGMFPLSLVHAYFRGDEPWEVLQRSETVPPFSSLPSSQHLGGEGRTDRNQKKNNQRSWKKITWLMHGTNRSVMSLQRQ